MYGPLRLNLGTEDGFPQSSIDSSDYKCKECRTAFTKPLATTLSSTGKAETYYGCPRCLAKISGIEKHRDQQESKSEVSLKKNDLKQSKEEGACSYSFGYLGKRSKDAPIPEECLTCSRMIECMIK